MSNITPERKKEIVDAVFEKLIPEDRIFLAAHTKDALILFHNNLGRAIRNDFGLWELKWTPELDKRGYDMSPDHPDAISMSIIEDLWMKCQN